MSEEMQAKPSGLKKVAALLSTLVGGVYLLNIPLIPPDLLPDVPFIPHLDELVASAMFLWGVRTLGLKPRGILRGMRERKRLKAAKKELGGGG